MGKRRSGNSHLVSDIDHDVKGIGVLRGSYPLAIDDIKPLAL